MKKHCLAQVRLRFRKLTKTDINNYIETGEPIGKAGGYAIQGKAAIFIEQLEGIYSGVMGLPLFETQQLLNQYIKNSNFFERLLLVCVRESTVRTIAWTQAVNNS